MKVLLNRGRFLNILENVNIWDIIIIGGGATGLGIALDSSSRGYKTLLLEQSDFSKATSSRSTKLVHGGIRYLAQGNIRLVYEALRERGFLLKNAPHLVKKQKFIIPIFNWRMGIMYWTGLKLYEWLSGSLSFGKSRYLSKNEIIKNIPEIKNTELKGGILYYDGQFDDARLAINIAQTCVQKGGILLNYFQVKGLLKKMGNKISGVIACDLETKKKYSIYSKIVINATGVFSDSISRMDKSTCPIFIKPSQGTHIVLDKSFFSSSNAIVIPKTADGRVLFCVPWCDHVLVGTTDTFLEKSVLEPKPLEKEIDFILQTFNKYFVFHTKKSDILSAFSGLRPLFFPKNSCSDITKTKDISRSHKLMISSSGLISIIGGKWTTYRKMAEDAVDKAIEIGKLKKMPSVTKNLRIYGSYSSYKSQNYHWNKYGEDEYHIKRLIDKNPLLGVSLISRNSFSYTEAEVIWMVRYEMARTIEDVLARRFRLLFLNAKKAIDIAPRVAALMSQELSKDEKWEKSQITAFKKLAMQYYYPSVL
ncbi:glycerol-3-phosphate dehydrogenase/oxidase [Blattabacterium sp. DPU]|uniref:glycerol-3-phosphate dehydrogenase/oxidase n=1 Tax=Blattabacterium sp. DPU TaxID=2715232 RepID=UPI001409D75B|nr:glycerol-3-phosphate dehydrogenase/oxidase [Blattabacterium sp. DPU]QIK16803.1 glycerol-3-phosphate dehydrogenase/oxidase [Blattabacterium sp. DPU]